MVACSKQIDVLGVGMGAESDIMRVNTVWAGFALVGAFFVSNLSRFIDSMFGKDLYLLVADWVRQVRC